MSDKLSKVKTFLKKIKQIESSNGRNFDHSQMKAGIHAGHKAIGNYGLMPNTVSEVLNRMRIRGTLTPELKQLHELDPVALKTTLESNPQLEDQIAEDLATRILSRQPDEDMAAYSWNQGHNLTPEAIATRPYLDSDYVKKYRSYKNEDEEG